MCLTKCPYDKDINSMELSLLVADHITAFHKLETGDLVYFNGKKVIEKQITDKDGKEFTALCVE